MDGTVWISELEALLYSRHVSRQSLYPATVSSISVLNTILRALQSLWEQLAVWLIPLICCCRCGGGGGHKTPDKSNLGKKGFFWLTLQRSNASLPGSHGGWQSVTQMFALFPKSGSKEQGLLVLRSLSPVLCNLPLPVPVHEMVLPISSLGFHLIQFRNSLTGACDTVTQKINCLLCTYEDLSLEPQYAH